MNRTIALLFALVTVSACLAAAPPTLLLQHPTLSATQIAFVYAGDLWIVPREGGVATRLTSGAGTVSRPFFSPDGNEIAFTGDYNGNADVYVIPAQGGEPRRLTYHPSPDLVMGWTRDGKQVLFASSRHSYESFNRLFTISREGGFPTELPLPIAAEGSYSPDGGQIAYVPLDHAFEIWKRYRGGRTSPIWIAQLRDSSVTKIPRDNSNDFNPIWVDQRILFLSDRQGPITLFSYDTRTKSVTPLLKNDGFDFKYASAGPGAIVVEQFGALYLYDLKTGKERKLDIRVEADLPQLRTHFIKVAGRISNADLSPTGKRAVFDVRGEILTVPAEKGDIRNITNTPGADERSPAWSPEGERIAYFSDESGEYALYIKNQNGLGEAQRIDLGSPGSFFYFPTWSPDGKKIAYTDKRLNLWYVDLEKKTPVRVFHDRFTGPQQIFRAAWSPDSKWLAYTQQELSHMRSVFLYSLETGESRRVTDGMSDSFSPVFDKSGKYLYLLASTDTGPTLDDSMMSYNRPVTSSVYVAVLRKDLPSPLAPESDEEQEAKPESSKERRGLRKSQPTPRRESGLRKDWPANSGVADSGQELFGVAARQGRRTLYRGRSLLRALEWFELAHGVPVCSENAQDRQAAGEPPGVLRIGRWRENALPDRRWVGEWRAASAQSWFIGPVPKSGDSAASTAGPPPEAAKPLNLASMEVRVDPPAEWRQIYHEAFRLERDFFYDGGFHGLDLMAAEKKYEPYLAGVGSRARPQLHFQGSDGEPHRGSFVCQGRRKSGSRAGPCGAAGRGLPDREWPVSLFAHL